MWSGQVLLKSRRTVVDSAGAEGRQTQEKMKRKVCVCLRAHVCVKTDPQNSGRGNGS